MRVTTRRIYSAAGNPWFVVAGGVCSIIGFLWHLYDRIAGQPAVISGIALAVALIALLIGYVYSIRVRTENIALREVAGIFNEINRIYRLSLQAMFQGATSVQSATDLVHEEHEVLRSVCERIALIYERLTGRRCAATVKLVT